MWHQEGGGACLPGWIGEHSPEPNKDAVYSSSMHAIRSSVRDLPERVLLIRSVSRSERVSTRGADGALQRECSFPSIRFLFLGPMWLVMCPALHPSLSSLTYALWLFISTLRSILTLSPLFALVYLLAMTCSPRSSPGSAGYASASSATQSDTFTPSTSDDCSTVPFTHVHLQSHSTVELPRDLDTDLYLTPGPGSGPEGSLSIHPNPHAESQGSHTHTHDIHTNSQSSHAHSYIQTHSSYIHPRSHSSHSPASYASYPTTGSSIDYSTGGYSTTGSSAGEHPPTTSSADEYPTTGGYLPNASLVENYHPTGSSVPAVDEMSVSVSGQAEGNIGVTRGRESGYGHGHSESVSTVRGLPMSSSHQYHGYGAHSVSSAPSTASEQAEQAGGQGYSPNSAQHVSVSTEFVPPTFQGRVQGQTQQRAARKVHQFPPRRGRNHRPEQGSGLPPYPHGASTARGNVSQSGKGQGQSAGQLQPQESAPSRTRSGSATTGAAPTTRKRARAPKRLRAGLTSNASATSVPIGGGGGDSDDDSDDEEDCEPSSTGFGGPGASRGPDAGGTGGGQGNTGGETGVAGPRK
ncbi:hypothetical protein M404DRAFT_847263 [Pisolithus tinctorius Marx 270]|uniref:Uncharacterized protein n=1 Tax=Pisolithus tinctorius Marx 270 TaxID=870435 RepID=A0A0C3JLQ6_PISTI|nr:hypothetical protein M404DRAFT_847263 [Pisolithus tinctorius Marx 270]